MTRHILALLVPACLACTPAVAADPEAVEHADSDAMHVHRGSATDTVGDILTFAEPIYDAAKKAKVGSGQGYCVRLVVGKAYECH